MKLFLSAFFLLVWVALAQAQIAVVQSAGAQSNSPVSSITTGDIDTTAGNLIICDTSVYFSSGTVFGPSDNKGNGYSLAIIDGSSFAPNPFLQQHYQANANGGTGHNFTNTSDGNDSLQIACKEVSGALTAGVLDKVASKADNSGTSGTSNLTATTSQANELLAGAAAYTSNTGTTNWTSTGGFTDDQNFNMVWGSTTSLVSASKVVSATGTYEYTFTTDTSGSGMIALIGTYKAAAAAAAIIRRPGIVW